jgi:hypothetical protein
MISFCGTARAVWVSAFMASSGGGGYCWAGGEDNPAARGGGENYCEEISDERAPSRNSWKRPVPKRPGSLQRPPSAHWVPESAVDGGTLQILMAFGDAASDWSPEAFGRPTRVCPDTFQERVVSAALYARDVRLAVDHSRIPGQEISRRVREQSSVSPKGGYVWQ